MRRDNTTHHGHTAVVRVLLLGLTILALPAVASAQPSVDPVPIEGEPSAESEYDFTALLVPDHPLVETLPAVYIRRRAQWLVSWRMNFLAELLRSTERLF